uniref:hypothetical protein n=1 Tax=Prevotella aurantiaca TaxID=596085 RepID=UPI0011DD33A3|nr:hypothetical protein [Prevotella aurantiaca]
MPTQKNYNKYKDSILKDIHQGKDIDLLSKEYSIPTPLVKEWETQDKNFNDLDASFSELSSKSRDRISFSKKAKSILVFHILKERFLILFFLPSSQWESYWHFSLCLKYVTLPMKKKKFL